jgi:hypothetical protein
VLDGSSYELDSVLFSPFRIERLFPFHLRWVMLGLQIGEIRRCLLPMSPLTSIYQRFKYRIGVRNGNIGGKSVQTNL